MKSIFVPTDFSDCALNALDMAVYLAKHSEATIHIAHGFDASSELIGSDLITPFQGVPGTLAPEQIAEYLNEHNKYIEDKLKELESLCNEAGVNVKIHKVQSPLFEDLAQKANEIEANLVVMGSHGSKGLKESLIGSNTQKFVRYSEVPVLVIKERPSSYKVYNVAFASTFSDEGEKDIYAEFKELFSKHPIFTHFLMVNTPGKFYDTPTAKDRIHNFMKDVWPSEYSSHVYNDYSVEEGILNFSRRKEIDLIVMATHAYQGMKRVFHSSVTESIINHAKLPVLCFRLKENKD